MVEAEGLTTEEAKKKLEIYGYNSIPELKHNQVIQFLKKFWGITPIMLEGTIILEWLIGKQVEALIILFLLFFNALIGYFQERKTNSSLELLKQQLPVTVKIMRDHKWILMDAKNLVPGDIIRLRSGDFVVADAKIINGNLAVDQSSLTGESQLIDKIKEEFIYSGSMVKRGEATAVVIKTGLNTKFGQTAELIQIAKPKLHIQEFISKVVKILLSIVICSILIVIIVSLIENINIFKILPLLVLLLVSAIPVALPTMFTIGMALGSLKLSKSGLLITRLEAIDDASTMNILCVDKTGTISTNMLRITNIIASFNFQKEDVIRYGVMASEAANQDPIDLAFISKLKELKLSIQDYLKIDFIPFNPTYRRTEAIIEKGNKRLYIIKGAVKEIFNAVSDSREIQSFKAELEHNSFKDNKLIAVATGNTKEELKLVGIVEIHDEIRPDSPELVSELRNLGVSLKMLTGDALEIAQEVAENINLGKNIKLVSDLKKSINTEELSDLLEDSDGFAEIFPEDKYLIVKRFQELGYVVGMTGDGVNDAPALKQAEVGIAVSNANDIAKNAASAVLTVEGLKGIVELIKQGRNIFQRVLIWITNKIIKTFYTVLFIILANLILHIEIITSLYIILFLFLTDYVTISIATDNVEFSHHPETVKMNQEIILGCILGTLIILEGFSLLFLGNFLFNISVKIGKLHTYVFLFLILIGYFSLLCIREDKHFWSSKPSNFLMIAMGSTILIVFIISFIGFSGFSALPLNEIIFVFLYCIFVAFIINDFIKFGIKKYFSLRFNKN